METLYNDLTEYNMTLEQLSLQTNITGIEECDSQTLTEFMVEIINKSMILMRLLYSEYSNTNLILGHLDSIYFSSRLESILDDVVTSIIPDSSYIAGYYDIIYNVGDELIEDCYLELKRFVHKNENEMDMIERLSYEKIIKDMAVYLKNTGYFDKPLTTNVVLGI